MHRLLVLIALLLVILETPVLAQEDEEEPLPPPRRHMQTKIGGGGGFTQNLLFLDLDPINSVLSASKATPFDKVPLVLLGGEGYGYILVVPNLRIGGLGASGSMNTKSVDTSVSPGISRDIDLSVGFGGVTIGYVVPVMPRLDVAFGVMLGGGNLTIKSRLDHGTTKLWGDLWDELKNNTPAQDYTRKFTGTFFMYQPSVNVEFA